MMDRDAIRDRCREQGFIVGDQFATALQLMVKFAGPSEWTDANMSPRPIRPIAGRVTAGDV